MTKEIPYYIPEPYGLPYELTEAGKFKRLSDRKKKILGTYTEKQWDKLPLWKRGDIIHREIIKLKRAIKLRKVI